jgi:hypothetical protein
MQGITAMASAQPDGPDTLLETTLDSFDGKLFDVKSGRPTIVTQDHVTVLVRPSVICFDTLFDPASPDKRGTLVTPYRTGQRADVPPPAPPDDTGPIVPLDLLTNTAIDRQSVSGLVSAVVQGCLPKGRYAISLVYPDGQAWTVPNETGACALGEQPTDYANLLCTARYRQRPILYSQGTRAVVEVVDPQDPANCQPNGLPGNVPPVPPQCLAHP